MKNIFDKKPDNDKHKMEFADYALAVFIGLVLVGLLFWLTEVFL